MKKILFFFTVFFCVTILKSATLTVTSLADTGPGTLRTLISGASNGDAIVFAASTNGFPITITSAYIPTALDLTITGNGEGVTFLQGDASNRSIGIFSGAVVTISSMTIRNGRAIGSGGDRFGGGVYAESSTLHLNNVTFSGNSCTEDGGGVYYNASSGTITDCTFSSNFGNVNAGGLGMNVGSSVVVTRCNFNSNSTTQAGAAVAIDGATVSLNSCSFDGNTASSDGGGVYIQGNSTVDISWGTFTSNVSGNKGGAIDDESTGPTDIENCYICTNKATVRGGGIYKASSGSFSMINTAIINNSIVNASAFAGSGGGIEVNAGSGAVTLTNITISGNWANYRGGGVFGGSNVDFKNCVIWGNTTNNTPSNPTQVNIDNYGSINYSLVEGKDYTAIGTGNHDGTLAASDPLFVSSVAPNKSSPTCGDYRLTSTSPIIDQGNNADNTTALDLDSVTRIIDGPDPDAIATIDFGAYEFPNGLPIKLGSFTGSCSSGSILLTWVTLSEINNDYFTIENSMDAVTFNQVADIAGAGNSSDTKNYELYDDGSAEGAYYRLKQTDFDGKYTYSDVIYIKGCGVAEKVHVYPTIVKDKLTIILTNSDQTIQLLNSMGQHIQLNQTSTNVENVQLDMSHLATGVYYVQVTDVITGYLVATKVIKQ